MIIQLVARNVTDSLTCAQGNSSCSPAQSNNTYTLSPLTTSGGTHTPFLTRRNLTGLLVLAALLVAGFSLWLCFGRWSKPIRHFFRRKSRSSSSRHSACAIPFEIGDAVAAPSVPRGSAEGAKAEKAAMRHSSTQSTLLYQDAPITRKTNGVELALPAKVLQTKSGSRHVGLIR